MKNIIYKRNITTMTFLTIITIVIAIALLKKNIINVANIIELGTDFQYNIMNFSGVLAGFLFAGIGILISSIDRKRIKRLWDYHYLDNMYYSAAGGIFACIINIVVALFLICGKVNMIVIKWVVMLEIMLILLSMAYFGYCTIRLFKLISKLKEE